LDRCFKLVLGFAKATPKSVAMLECDKYSWKGEIVVGDS
jgi:hypothetical protein